VAHKEPNFRFSSDWTKEEIEEIHADYQIIQTIPINIEIEAENKIYDFGSVEKYLRNASSIAIQDCKCRNEKRHCDAPLDVCMLLNWRAEKALRCGKRNVRRASLNEALSTLRRSVDSGLVLTSIVRKGDESPNTICSCCSCCCYTLSGVLRFGLASHLLSSDMTAMDREIVCSDCGRCVDRCHFGARIFVGKKMVHNPDRCFGCGLCVPTCPDKVISLKQRVS